MIIIIGVLFICLLLNAYAGDYLPSFISLSGFDSTTLLNVIDGTINYCKIIVESLSACYHDFMASSKIVSFFKYYLPYDQNPGTMVLLGFGFVGLWGYGRKSMKK